MKRRAIIIECPNSSTYQQLQGTGADVAAYTSFLKSCAGGAWDDSEIQTFTDPKKDELVIPVVAAGNADYTLVTFSGHGYVDGTSGETMLCLRGNDEIPTSFLDPKCDRVLMVCDSCRGVERAKNIKSALAMSNLDGPQQRALAKAAFCKSVSAAEKGIIKMFSCGLNESAGETNQGGVFSQSLVHAGIEWASNHSEKNTPKAFDAFEAFKIAKSKVSDQRQNPEYEGGRRRKHFTWAV